MNSYPSGTVTFLFTDIEGSTTLAQQYPDAMPALLAQHRDILQKSIQSQGGYIFQVVGDSFSAAFHSAREALHAALDAQIHLYHANWTPVPLKVRMGIHTGAATLADDPSIAGPYAGYSTVALTQRIMSAAHGGQILLSQSTYELTRDAMAKKCRFIDMGERHLKSILRPVHLYQLNASDLPSHFPALKTLDDSPHNLPEQLTSFIGREKEISEIQNLLHSARLVTLTGPGGTGKTRLSQEVGAQELTNFAHGVWFIEFASLTDPSQIIPAMAQVFGLQESQFHSLVNIVLDYLRDKAMLLILDNCEHLTEACARLANDLLHQCTRLKILASSREVLGIAGELAYHVPSLADAESTQLFLDRARAIDPNFIRTESNASFVDQICSRLDGIPLAIELAAARVKLLSPEQIAARLDDRFRLLVGGSRTALPRQQTLRALIDWSYDLLSEAERSALAYLSVFAGGWTLEAAEAVLGPDGLDLLSNLADKSLVLIEETATGEKRYSFLETIRQYARDKLIESNVLSKARDLHLNYYLRFGEEVESQLEGTQMLPALNKLEPELDNIRAALEWALQHNPETALRLAVSLTYFWQGRGHITEGRQWLGEALSRWESSPIEYSRSQKVLKAKALYSNGVLTFAQGELIATRSVLTESVRLAREAGEQHTLVMSLVMLGFTVIWLGDSAAAESVIEEGMRLAQAIDYKFGKGMMLMVRANHAAGFQHDFMAARAYGEEGLRLMREVGNPFFTAIAIMGSGSVALAQGNYAEARARLEESEKLFYELGDRHMALGVRSERAHIERQLGNYPQALELYHQSIRAWQEVGHRVSLAREFECLAFIACTQSQPHRAARLLGAAEGIRESLNSPMTATERIEYDQNMSALSAQMDEPYLQQAWAEGRAMMLEHAVELALEDVDS